MKALRLMIQRGLRATTVWLALWTWRRTWVRQIGAQWPLSPIEYPEWQRADAETLLRFFQTDTGRKLQVLMRRMECDFNASAVLKQPSHLVQACGYAAGFRAAFAYLITLSANLPPQSEEDAHKDENAGESLLRERLSP